MSEQHDERLAEIQARLAAATPGRWDYIGYSHSIWIDNAEVVDVCKRSFNGKFKRSEHPGVQQTIYGSVGGSNRENDAAFIAAAPEDIAWLISHVERLRAEVERLSENSRYLFKSEREQLEKRLRAEAQATAAEAACDAARAALAALNVKIAAVLTVCADVTDEANAQVGKSWSETDSVLAMRDFRDRVLAAIGRSSQAEQSHE